MSRAASDDGPERLLGLSQLVDRGAFLARRGSGAIVVPVGLFMGVLPVAYSALQAIWARNLDPGDVSAGLELLMVMALLLPFSLLVLFASSAVLSIAASQRLLHRQATTLRATVRFLFAKRTLATVALKGAVLVVSLLCLGLPVLVVGPLLSLVVPVMVFEGRFGVEALKRSSSLVWSTAGQRGTRPFFLLIVIFLAYCAVSNGLGLAVQLPYQITYLVAFWRNMLAGEDPTQAVASLLWLQVPTQMLSSLVQSWVLLYVSFCGALLYRMTVLRREAPDLEARISVLEGALQLQPFESETLDHRTVAAAD